MRVLLLWIFFLLSCASARAESEAFPQQIRGFWADKKATCDVLKTRGPGPLRQDQFWLKITATEVLGSTQGRFFRELPARSPEIASAQMSFEIQMFGESDLMEELTLTSEGHLYERIVGARAFGTFLKC